MSSKLKIVRKGYPRYYPTGGSLWNINLRLSPPTQSDWNAFNNIDWSDSMLSRIAMTNLGGLGKTFKIGADRLVNNFGNTDNYSLMKIPSLFGATRSDTGVSTGTGTGTEGGFLKMSTKKVSRPKTPEEMQKEKNRLVLMSAGLNAVGSIDTGDPRGAFDTLDPVYHLAGGRLSKVGNALSDTGVSLTKTGNPWLMLAGAGLKVIGGLTNAAWGIKENKANVDFINNSIANKRNSGNLLTQATTSDELLKSSGTMTGGSGFGVGDLYEGGWFSGDSATNKGKSLIGLEIAATNFLNHGLMTGALSVDLIGDDNIMRNFTAYGGPLESIDPSTAIGYSFMNLYIANRKQDKTASNMFAGTSDNMFDGGGFMNLLYNREIAPIILAVKGKYKKGEYKGGEFNSSGATSRWKPAYRPKAKVFNEAFDEAKAAGADTFMFGDLEYSTKSEANPLREANNRHVGAGRTDEEVRQRGTYGRDLGPIRGRFSMLPVIEYGIGGPLFAEGGNIQTHGGNFSNNLVHVNTGGTHEESPELGVQMGVDLEGTPNLVEEGEVIYNDYVFSNRLTVPKFDRKDKSQEARMFRKYSGKTFADAAKKIEKRVGADERIDDITQKGLDAELELLAQLLEEEREKEKAQQLKDAIDLMSPEELAMLLQQILANLELANLLAMQELMILQQQMQLPLEVPMDQLQLYLSGYPQEAMQMAPELMALGGNLNKGNLFPFGGSFEDFSNELQSRGLTVKDYLQYLVNNNMLSLMDMDTYLKDLSSLKDNFSTTLAGWYLDDLNKNLKTNVLNVEVQLPQAQSEQPQTTKQLDNPIRSVAAHYGKEPDAWNKLSEAEKNKYIRKYRREGLKNREERRAFDLELENYNNKVTVEEFLKKQRNSTLNDNDIKDINDFDTLERLAKTVNSRYESLDLKGKSINELNAAKDKLKKDIVQWSKDNNVTIGNINDNFTNDRYKDWSTVNPDEAWVETQNGYNWNNPLYGGDNTVVAGNTEGKYIPRNWTATEGDNKGKIVVGDNAYNSMKDYELSEEYLKPRYELAKSAAALDEAGQQLWNNYVKSLDSDYTNSYTPITVFGENYADNLGSYEDFANYIRNNYNEGNLSNSGFFDLLAGQMHGLFIPTTARNRELYKVLGVDGYFNPSDDWKDYYDEISVDNTSDANGTTTTHTLAPKKGINITRATSLPDDIEVDTNGNYIKVDPKTKGTVGIKGDATFPKAPSWPYLLGAGLLGGALLYNLLSPKDYSNADAMIKAGMQAGQFRPIEFRPEGTFLTYKPMDIWREQNRLDANARAVDRSLANNAAPISTQMAAQVSNAYKNQLANADLHMKGLEYNDALAEKKGAFNRATGQFNSEGFLKADMANQEAAARARGYQLEGLKSGYAMRQAIDDAKASAINAGINGIASNIMNYALNKYNQDMLAWLILHNPYPIPGYKVRTGTYIDGSGAKGGKLKRRKKGLSF